MYDKLTENDIKKMQEEIDYRKPVPRAISAKTLNTKLPNRTKTATKAASAIWKK